MACLSAAMADGWDDQDLDHSLHAATIELSMNDFEPLHHVRSPERFPPVGAGLHSSHHRGSSRSSHSSSSNDAFSFHAASDYDALRYGSEMDPGRPLGEPIGLAPTMPASEPFATASVNPWQLPPSKVCVLVLRGLYNGPTIFPSRRLSHLLVCSSFSLIMVSFARSLSCFFLLLLSFTLNATPAVATADRCTAAYPHSHSGCIGQRPVGDCSRGAISLLFGLVRRWGHAGIAIHAAYPRPAYSVQPVAC